MAAEIGFDQSAREEIILVLTELATNLMRLAGGGNLIFKQVSVDRRLGIQIESHDEGPGVESIEKMFAQELLQRLARKEDDATVIVVKSAH